MDRDGSFTFNQMPAGDNLSAPPVENSRGIRSRKARRSPEQPPARMIAPLAPLLAALAAGIVADRWFLTWETVTFATMVLGLGVAAVVLLQRASFSHLAVLGACFSIGAGWHHVRWSDLAADDLALSVTETPQPAWVRGTVSEARGLRHKKADFGFGAGHDDKVSTRFVIDVRSISDGRNWHDASGRAAVVVTGDRSDIRAGQAIEAAGLLAAVAPPLNPGEFDYRAFLRAQGVRLQLTIDNPEGFRLDRGGATSPFVYWIDCHRHRIQSWLFEQIEPSTAPLAAALILGWRDEIEPEINDAFARTGTTHLLAVSGLQLQALAAALLLLLRSLGVPRRPAYVIVLITMVGYALLVGLAPSVAPRP